MPVSRTNKARHRVKTVRLRKKKLIARLEKVREVENTKLEKEMDNAVALDDQKEWSKMTVTMPKGCKKDALSLNALDGYSRELAAKSFVTVGGQRLPCTGFKLLEDGTLRVDVHPEAVEIVR